MTKVKELGAMLARLGARADWLHGSRVELKVLLLPASYEKLRRLEERHGVGVDLLVNGLIQVGGGITVGYLGIRDEVLARWRKVEKRRLLAKRKREEEERRSAEIERLAWEKYRRLHGSD